MNHHDELTRLVAQAHSQDSTVAETVARIEALDDTRPTARPITRTEAGGPAWRAAVIRRDLASGALVLGAYRAWPDGTTELLDGFAPDRIGGPARPTVNRTTGPDASMMAPSDDAALVIHDNLAQALYLGLAEHFGGGGDARTVREDLLHTRKRHDQVVDTLASLAAHLVGAVAAPRRPGYRSTDSAAAMRRITDMVAGPPRPGDRSTDTP